MLGDEHHYTLSAINNLGALLIHLRRFDEAEPYLREALEGRRRVLGKDHPTTLTSINNMGALLYNQGRLDEAEPYLRAALESCRRLFGKDHPHTLSSIGNLSILLHRQGKLDEAEKLARELVGERPATDPEHISGKKILDDIDKARKAADKQAPKKTDKSP